MARRLRFEDAPGMGLVVTARRHFAVGEVVLAEAPLLRWPADSMLGLFRAYAALPAPARQASMSLYCSPDPSVDPTYGSAVAFSEHLAKTGRLPALDSSTSTTEAVATYAALAVTARLNAFAFDGVHGAQHLPVAAAVGAPRGGTGDWRALFANASRFEHSCAPNAVYSSAFGDGIARWTAIHPVAPDDRVAISYWAGHVWASTPARRADLRASHDFVCACVVCEAPDRRRAVSCRRRKCGGVATPPSWACCSCGRGAGAGDVEAKEQRMEAALAELRKEKRFGGRVKPAAVETLVTDAHKALSPTHWTVVALLREVEDSCAAGCRAAMASSGGIIPLLFGHASGKNVGPLVGLQLRGIAACMHAIKAVECMEAGYGHGGPCHEPHPPVYECAGMAFQLGEWLLNGVALMPPQPAVAVVAKYVHLLRIRRPDGDEDVAAISRAVVGWQAAPLLCGGCRAEVAAGRPAAAAVACGRCGGQSYCGAACRARDQKAHLSLCVR